MDWVTRFFRHRKLSLHAGLMLAIVLTCCTLLALDGWRAWQARETVLAADKEETSNLARSLAEHAHDMIQAADTILFGLQERVAQDGLTPANLERLHRLMTARVNALPLIHALFVYDSKGNWLANSLAVVPSGLNNNDRAYFQHHRTNGDLGAYVGRPVQSKSDGSWIITVSRRLSDADGQFAGLVLATISIADLNAYYAKFDVGVQGVISLTTADGLLVARKNADNPAIGTDLFEGQIFRDFLPHSPIGSFRYKAVLSSIDRLGSYRRIPGYPLVIVVAHGFDEVLASWRADARVHLAIDAFLVLTLLGLGDRFTHQIKRHLETERHYRLLADNSSDAIACTTFTGRRLYVSPAFTTLVGRSVEEAVRREWRSDVHPRDWHIIEDVCARLQGGEERLSACYRYTCKAGAHLWVEAHFRLLPNEPSKEAQFVANIRDISARKLAEDQLVIAHQQLAVQASTDALTGLANRRRFDEVVQQEWQRAARNEQPLSLLLVDVDRFKLYNDRYGHQQGDRCLKVVATAIANSARRPADLVARYGGEEIVILLPDTDASGAARVAEAVRSAIQASVLEHEGNLPFGVVTGSIGVATLYPSYDLQTLSPDRLVADADTALYHAKQTGRNRVANLTEFFTSQTPPVLADEATRLSSCTEI